MKSDSSETEQSSFMEILQAVEYLVSLFRASLEAKGVRISSIQYEVEDFVEYSRKYCSDSNRWPNVLRLAELTFCLPFTSHVEQTSSCLKTAKTKLRTRLDVDTLHEISIEGPSLKHFDVKLCN